ncbi:MAG: site-2 protease family protein [Planctomycetota bacterium]|jgi:regulator of sigma E protease
MIESKGLFDFYQKYFRLVSLVIVLVALIYFISLDFLKFWNIFLALMGFSAVVFVHELGHFIFAKLSDVKVEVFSIFLPPVLLGIRRTEEGFRFRILPKFFPKKDDPDGDGMLSFTAGKRGKAGETEYRIGLVPLAGYVKMLGQEDTGADKPSDDPRAFCNKPMLARMVVIAAGVTFNVIAAILIMMAVYLMGIHQAPAVVGGVLPNSPAEAAGVRAGDEILEIGGKSNNLDYINIMIAAALSDKGEAVPLKVRHEDGTVEDFKLVAEKIPGMSVRIFGFTQPLSLRVAEFPDANAADLQAFHERTGFLPGDTVKSVEGREVGAYWHMEEIIRNMFVRSVSASVERTDSETGEVEVVESQLPLEITFNKEAESESELGHIYSMLPRLKISFVSGRARFNEGAVPLKKGDVIVGIGGIENPTYKELRDVTESHKGRELAIKFLRTDLNGVESALTTSVIPEHKVDDGPVVIGIDVVYNAAHTVVAKTIDSVDGTKALSIPRGARIVAVDGVEVSDFYEVISQIRRNVGQLISIDYRVDADVAGNVVLEAGSGDEAISVITTLDESVLFEFMQRLYKADGPVEAFVMGAKKSLGFVVQTYVTLKQLFTRNVDLGAMSGPVGIATMSYEAVKYSFVTFLYLLAFISANLAVINFLPIPVVDGGVFVLLIVEKIKGGPVSIKVQEVMTYAGLAFILLVFVYLTYNDVLRLIFG